MKKSPEPTKVQGDFKGGATDCISRSSSVEDQRERAINALRERPHTSYELRKLGLYQCGARILELRYQFGYDIRTERVTLYDEDGYLHPNAARYHLISEPADGFVPKANISAAAALRDAAKALRAEARGLERNSIKVKHVPNVRHRLIDALRVLDALERREVAGDAGASA